MGEIASPIIFFIVILFILTILGTVHVVPKMNPGFLHLPRVTNPILQSSLPNQGTETDPFFNEQHAETSDSALEGYKYVKATVFWVGEAADENNAFIPNDKSAWESSWQDNFGGVDDPSDRCGFHPCKFTPKQNPFYFALPYNDLTLQGQRKASAQQIPWFEEHANKKSVVKNQWVELKYKSKTCYAQWEDVGPLETDDFEYVFGDQPPKNTWGVAAGIDVSPAAFTCLGLLTNDFVNWKFVDESQVPQGPWKDIVTTTEVTWQ